MNEERKKRAPAIEKRISDISKEDIRVSIIGAVVELQNEIDSFVIDDGTGSLNVILPEDANKVKEGQFVRVIGLVAPALEGEGFELKGEIIQDFSKLNKELYTKYLKLKSLN